ncbi:MAG TPA: hypothetical protein VHG89_12495 [Verrucomicrobiae bacterium]|nr:hypothetical protein [Verrucomicrobiae bacterium]
MNVFIVQHSYEVEPCGHDETKFIGVYSSREAAVEAVKRLSEQPGFCDKLDCFFIDEYEVGKDHWTKGFVTVQPGQE